MESGGSGPEKDDPPGKTDLYNTQLLYSGAALPKCVCVCVGGESVFINQSSADSITAIVVGLSEVTSPHVLMTSHLDHL